MKKITYILLLLFAALALSACNTSAPTPTVQADDQAGGAFDAPLSNQAEIHEESGHEDEDHDHVHLDEDQATTDLTVVLVPSELVVGSNRFAVGLIDAERHMIQDAEVHFHYYDVSDPNAPVLESEADAVMLQTPDGLTTAFVHERTFERAGNWGVEVQAQLPNGETAVERIAFQVLTESAAITPGEQAPAVDTLTAADVDGDLTRLTSAQEPDEAFYAMSLAEALSSGRPTVLLFATPAFCQTRFCGPAYEIAGELRARHGEDMNFIHVEIYTGMPDPSVNNWELAPAMNAFGLHTEPWLYLIDADGTVAYRVEGMFTTEEVEGHIQELLAG